MNRRTFLMAAGLAAAGCGRSRPRLRVFCYAGGHDETMRRVFVPAFEKATGAECELHPGWWDGVPKLKLAAGGEPPFDLVISDATQGYPAIKEGLFAEINQGNIPNLRHLAAPTLDNHVFKGRHGVPYPDSVMTLAYGRAKASPKGWADLLKVKGGVGLYRSFYMSLFTFACMRADLDGKPGTAHELIENDMQGTLRFAKEHRAAVKVWWPNSADMILALKNGDCAAGNMHSPEYLAAMRDDPGLAAVAPEKDRALVQVFWSVAAGSRQHRLAEDAIDVLFSEECQFGFARRGMATPLPDVAAKVAKEDALWGSLYPHTAEQFRALRYYPYEAYAANWNAISDAWDRTVLAAG